jgi:hypothetical protein
MDDTMLFSLKLSVQVATVATLFVVIVGLSAAYLLARKNFFGNMPAADPDGPAAVVGQVDHYLLNHLTADADIEGPAERSSSRPRPRTVSGP